MNYEIVLVIYSTFGLLYCKMVSCDYGECWCMLSCTSTKIEMGLVYMEAFPILVQI